MDRPDFAAARIDATKVAAYLLGGDTPEGSPKARFFRSAGFDAQRWQVLAEALRTQALNSTLRSVPTRWGCKWVATGPLDAPGGRRYKIISVWIVERGVPRLVTAYPGAGTSP